MDDPDLALRDPRRPRRRRARRADRRGLAADLPDLDLRPGRRRPAARRLRVRAHARTRPASASSGRSRRSRAAATGSRSRAARRRPRRSPSSRPPATRSSSATTSTAARTATSSASTGRRASTPATSTSPPGPDVLWEELTERTRLVWFESPTNPLPEGHRHRRVGRGRPRARGPGRRPRPARRRRQHVRLAGAPAAARARRRHRLPLGDEVPRRPLRHGRRASRSRTTTRSPSGCGSSRTRWAACPGRSTASSSCAGCGRSTSASSGTPRTPRRSRRSSPARDDIDRVMYPGLADGPHAHPAAAIAARQMRAGGGMVSFIPAARDGRSARDRAVAICEATRLFTLAESLGGVESLIELPAVMTHLSVAGSKLEVDEALDPAVGRDRGGRRPHRGPRPGARPRLISRASRLQ